MMAPIKTIWRSCLWKKMLKWVLSIIKYQSSLDHRCANVSHKAVAKRAEGKAKARAKAEPKAKASVEPWANLDWTCSKLSIFPDNILQQFMFELHELPTPKHQNVQQFQVRSFEFVGGVSHYRYRLPCVSTLKIFMTCFCSNIVLGQPLECLCTLRPRGL